jgi:hypothetical protein
MAPFVGSWLGRGTSLRGRGDTRREEACGVTDVASCFEVVEMVATDWKGSTREEMTAAGLAFGARDKAALLDEEASILAATNATDPICGRLGGSVDGGAVSYHARLIDDREW